jgi:uncharacterized protein
MNIQENFWKVSVWVGIMLFVFLAVISIKELKSIDYVGLDTPITNTISVNGTGDAVSIPDIATFSFTVTETAKTVVDAQTLATNKINTALKAVKDAGVADKDIQTTSYNINPHYEYQTPVCNTNYCPSGKSILTGYDVSQSIEVKVRDLGKAGSIFTSIGSLGVQNVNGLTFSVDKPEKVQAEARAKAITDAQTQAKELAKQLGVSLVRITSFYENNGVIRPMAYGIGGATKTMAADSIEVAPSIPVGENKVTSDVTITYEIK